MYHLNWNEKVRASVRWLQRFVNRVWYPPLVGLLAAADNFVVVVPTDGILVSSTMLKPKRWIGFASSVAIGSTVGAILLAAFVESHGLPWILDQYPGLSETRTWVWSAEFFERYGLLLVFGVAATPLMQQPAVILASLANTPLMKLAAVIFLGRFLKYLIMAYVASHAPNLLRKMWGVKGEMQEVGVKIPD